MKLPLSKIFYIVFPVVCGALVYAALYPSHTATIGSHGFRVEVAATEQARRRGLSGRIGLPADNGMLFVFGKKTEAVFWMKGMTFPLDIIWIADGRVTGAVQNAPADNGATSYAPPAPIDYALEVSAGTVKALDILPGAPFVLR